MLQKGEGPSLLSVNEGGVLSNSVEWEMKPLLKSGKVSGAQRLQVHTSYEQKQGDLFYFIFEADQNRYDFEGTEIH